MSRELDELLEKWEPVLDHPDAPKITEKHRRQVTAVLLENQARADYEIWKSDPKNNFTSVMLQEAAPATSMGTSAAPSTPAAGSMDIYDPVMISMVRRTAPNLMVYDVCGVQPMTGPTGLIFALRARYSSPTGTEALFNEADTTFSASAQGNTASVTAVGGQQTGSDPSLLISSGNTAYTASFGMSTAAGEALGDDRDSNDYNEMSLSIERVSVTAKSRKLKAEYTHELAQDLKSVHSLDAETELADILSKEIMSETNREIIRSINMTATTGAQQGDLANAGTFDLDIDSNGRWMVEKFKGLLHQIDREGNQIAKDTRQGKGNFVICPSDVASAFAMAGVLDYDSGMRNERLDVDDTGNTYAGMLFGRLKVFVDPYFASSAGAYYVTTGYKGVSPFDAGLFYCPYVPLQMHRTVGEDTFQPRIGFMTRYGLVSHPFATSIGDGRVNAGNKNVYYRIMRVTNLV